MMTMAAKLTKTQAATLEKFRLATPIELREVGEIHGSSTMRDGWTHSRENRAVTIKALADRGYLEARVISSSRWECDEVKVADLGERKASIEAFPPSPACVTWCVRVLSETGRELTRIYGFEKSSECNVEVPAGIVERIAEIMTRHGWIILD